MSRFLLPPLDMAYQFITFFRTFVILESGDTASDYPARLQIVNDSGTAEDLELPADH